MNFGKIYSKNWFKNFRNLVVCLTASVLLTSSVANTKLALDSSGNLIKAEFGEKEFQKTFVQRLESLNSGNPEKLALVKISKYAGQFVNLSLGQKIEVEVENESKFSLQNLEFQELNRDRKHTIGFVAMAKNNGEKELEIEKPKLTQIGNTISQNVGGETAKSDYQKYKLELKSFLSSLNNKKPQNLLLSAFGIKMIDGKPDPEIIQEFTKRGYSLIWTAMAAGEGKGENNNISFGNVVASRGKIDFSNSKIKIRVPIESLSLTNGKNLNSETIEQMTRENSVLIYTNPFIERTQIDQNGNPILQIIGTNYFSFFSDQKIREVNFQKVANYCQTSLTKNPKTQILIMGDFNTMGVDGRDLGGESELETTKNQATNFFSNLGKSFEEIKNFNLILDNANFELWQQIPQNNQNPQNSTQKLPNKLEYHSSELPFRGDGVKEIPLKILNLTLDGTITNSTITNFIGEFQPNLYKINSEYFGNFDHPQTTFKEISQLEFEQIKKQKADKLATNIAIMQIMSR